MHCSLHIQDLKLDKMLIMLGATHGYVLAQEEAITKCLSRKCKTLKGTCTGQNEKDVEVEHDTLLALSKTD